MLQSEAERLAKTIRSEYAVQIQKLPKKVREMTVAEFFTQNAAYAKDLETDDLKALAAEFASTTAAAPPKEVEGMPTRTPFKVVQNQNGSQTVLRSTRLQSKFASVTSAVKRKPDEEEVFMAPRTTRRMTKNSQVLATPIGKGSAAVAQTPMLRPDLPCTPANNQHGGLGLAPPGTSLRFVLPPLAAHHRAPHELSLQGPLRSSALGRACKWCTAGERYVSRRSHCVCVCVCACVRVCRLPKRGESIMSARGSPGKVLTSDAKAQVQAPTALVCGTLCSAETLEWLPCAPVQPPGDYVRA